jgi:cytochrome c-type biogenesis protein CcmH
MLWLVFAILTAVAAGSILWPLARAPRAVNRSETGIAIYKAQLAEIERDEAQNALAPQDAQAARAEAARRLLADRAPAESPPATSRIKAWLAGLAVVIFVPAFSLSLYAVIGRPDLPDSPLTARTDLQAAIAKIEEHLREHPDDGRGYEVLAPVYLHLGRAKDAVNAARAALRLLGETPARDSLYGETLVAAAHGTVTEEARQVFEAAVAKDSSAATPRFFLGLAAEQAGDKARAKEIWSKLVSDAPQDAPWVKPLRDRLSALDDAAGEAANGIAAKIGALPEGQRMSAIRAMVERLAARLAQNGQDLEGWLRLIRSYAVLNEPGKARAAMLDAKRNLADDKDAISRLDALARELGFEG